ncbi:MAG: hypothetical protein ABSH05_19735 [Bryobacteraceae bacterium]|jgi:hypothetical protein
MTRKISLPRDSVLNSEQNRSKSLALLRSHRYNSTEASNPWQKSMAGPNLPHRAVKPLILHLAQALAPAF